jgi:hypothetical protein
MGRKSKIESHPQSEEIISLLFNGVKNPEILRKYSGISDDDLNYYREKKLPEKLSKSSELNCWLKRSRVQTSTRETLIFSLW